ncbi:ATP synthase subunit K [Sediminispirochaeta smaragdinae]|jgi:V/A-type H+-transporting ATPase subunit K|uniref:V-type ATP synthase subunit K n=1 Tax=Sediminispirochaeta smaragdinae (strain DSM 11293 / JCM 15392 / SEBR 4228) TaxID=573413 RepID=E1R3D8_SEDSS|nr:ATP synthase subunit K [Sediminispirochaeta smaragdinae]ADK81569.1 V-type ATP synthase subunit K [Sediminispirochaeta smaragdinae DSM 11293]
MNFGMLGIGAALAFAAMGSAFGAGAAGMAAVGAWKKCFAQNKPAPFMLVAFVGAPLTQTIYGYILMNTLKGVADTANGWLLLGVGLFGGIAMGLSAFFQGKAGAYASDALAETGKGFGNYIMVLGLIETVALFVMVFMMGVVG